MAIDLDSSSLHDPAVELADVLEGGEDHALVATVAGPVDGCRVIGRVLAGTGVTVDGRPASGGWRHWA